MDCQLPGLPENLPCRSLIEAFWAEPSFFCVADSNGILKYEVGSRESRRNQEMTSNPPSNAIFMSVTELPDRRSERHCHLA